MTYPKKQAEAQGIFQKTGGFVQGNLTLRDHFAGLAMQGLLSADTEIINALVEKTKGSGSVSELSYYMADAMLKAREA